MATKIRLQRGGRKGYAFYSIVIADARAPRDGKFTEKIGTYNPNTNPATVDLNFDRAFDEQAAQTKFDAWKTNKEQGLTAVREAEAKAKKEAAAKELEAEKKVNEAIAKKVADKKAAAAAAKAEAEAAAAEEAAPAEEAPAEA